MVKVNNGTANQVPPTTTTQPSGSVPNFSGAAGKSTPASQPSPPPSNGSGVPDFSGTTAAPNPQQTQIPAAPANPPSPTGGGNALTSLSNTVGAVWNGTPTWAKTTAAVVGTGLAIAADYKFTKGKVTNTLILKPGKEIVRQGKNLIDKISPAHQEFLATKKFHNSMEIYDAVGARPGASMLKAGAAAHRAGTAVPLRGQRMLEHKVITLSRDTAAANGKLRVAQAGQKITENTALLKKAGIEYTPNIHAAIGSGSRQELAEAIAKQKFNNSIPGVATVERRQFVQAATSQGVNRQNTAWGVGALHKALDAILPG